MRQLYLFEEKEISLPLRVAPEGIYLFAKITPNAAKNCLGPFYQEAQRTWLKVRIQAPAHEGKANEAIMELFSKKWDIPRKNIHLFHGITSRFKTFLITNTNTEHLKKQIEAVHP